MKPDNPGMVLLVFALLLTLMLLGGCESKDGTAMVGTLERDRIELKVESNEPLVAIYKQDGQHVSAGDVVLEQDANRALTRLAQQTALRDQAAARLAELERGPRQEAIRESRARLESLQAETRNSAAEFHRAQEVFDKGLSNQSTLDRAETAWKTATAQESAAREALASLLNGTTAEELQQAVAALSASQALVDQAGIDVARTRITAPVDGLIDKVLYQLGERPPAGTTVAVLLDSSRVYARIYVPEYLRSRVRPGDIVPVQVDGMANSLNGTVRWVSSDAGFTPYFALTEHDRSRLSYLAEVDVPDAADLPSGVPLEILLPDTE